MLSQQELMTQQAVLMKDMANDIRTIRQELTRWKGMAAGIILTVSAIWGVALAVWHAIKHKFA